METKLKLLYPDALYDINTISCASFMYFDKGKIGISLHPTVSMFLSGCDPYDFCKFVDHKNPSWKLHYFTLYQLWIESESRLHQTSILLKNMQEQKLFSTIWLAYAKTEHILDEADEFLSTLDLPDDELFGLINLDQAVQELMAHFHFEKILELYGTPSEISKSEFTKREVDYQLLFDYCNNFFKKYTIEKALVRAYFFRLITMQGFDNFMITNEKLIPLLSKLNMDKKDISESKIQSTEETLDVVSWEVFRQIVSPYIDEKESGIRISLTTDLLLMRTEEIKRLKCKCNLLAEEIQSGYNMLSLKQNVAKYVELNVEKDVQDLFALDKKTFSEVRDKIFSDEKTWLALMAFITSMFTGGQLIAAGAGLATLSNIFAKTYETKSNISKSVKKSDYALLYRIKNFYG